MQWRYLSSAEGGPQEPQGSVLSPMEVASSGGSSFGETRPEEELVVAHDVTDGAQNLSRLSAGSAGPGGGSQAVLVQGNGQDEASFRLRGSSFLKETSGTPLSPLLSAASDEGSPKILKSQSPEPRAEAVVLTSAEFEHATRTGPPRPLPVAKVITTDFVDSTTPKLSPSRIIRLSARSSVADTGAELLNDAKVASAAPTADSPASQSTGSSALAAQARAEEAQGDARAAEDQRLGQMSLPGTSFNLPSSRDHRYGGAAFDTSQVLHEGTSMTSPDAMMAPLSIGEETSGWQDSRIEVECKWGDEWGVLLGAGAPAIRVEPFCQDGKWRMNVPVDLRGLDREGGLRSGWYDTIDVLDEAMSLAAAQGKLPEPVAPQRWQGADSCPIA